jgi:hypothetical protein
MPTVAYYVGLFVIVLARTHSLSAQPQNPNNPDLAPKVTTPCLVNIQIPQNFAELRDSQGSGTAAQKAAAASRALAKQILGANVSLVDAAYTGHDLAAGFFSNGDCLGATAYNPTGLSGGGIILSTGNVRNVIGVNGTNLDLSVLPFLAPDADYICGALGSGCSLNAVISSVNGTPGDSVLSALAGGSTTYDAASLSITFTSVKPWLQMKYVFASEEYNEFVGKRYNDAFGFFLDGENVALLPAQTVPVSVNSVNNGNLSIGNPDLGGYPPHNAQYYIDNSNSVGWYNIQMDGMTVVMTIQAPLKSQSQHEMRLAITDNGDAYVDSNVFLQAYSLAGIDAPTDTDIYVNQVMPVTGNPNLLSKHMVVCAAYAPNSITPLTGSPVLGADGLYTLNGKVVDMTGRECEFGTTAPDGVMPMQDNCKSVNNPDQMSIGPEGQPGDACRDTDRDFILDIDDRCPSFADPTNACQNAPVDRPTTIVLDEIKGEGEVEGSDRFMVDVKRVKQLLNSFAVDLDYNDSAHSITISIQSLATSIQDASAEILFSTGVRLTVPCDVQTPGDPDTRDSSVCQLYLVDASSKNKKDYTDRFQVTVVQGNHAGYSSGAKTELVKGSLKFR